MRESGTSPPLYDGKIALVTGSRRGIGRVIAEHLLGEGATVVGFARGEATFEHPAYHHLQVSIDVPDQVQRAFQDVRARFGGLHITVNNAGVLTSQHAMILPPSAASAMLATNVLGTFMVSRESAKLMKRKRWGRIIHVGSMAARLEPVGDAVYAATKTAVGTLARVMARELAPFRITCNTVGVSAMQTDMLDAIPPAALQKVLERLPMPRLAEPDDVLNVIDFFASERSAYITGQAVYLGGA